MKTKMFLSGLLSLFLISCRGTIFGPAPITLYVSGKVTDSISKHPISSARIMLWEAEQKEGCIKEVLTDRRGLYHIEYNTNIPKGGTTSVSFYLVAEKENYETSKKHKFRLKDEIQRINFQLTPK